MSHPLDWLDDALADLDRSGLRRQLATRSSPQGARIDIDCQSLVNFGSNDYLGLASDPQIVAAAREALDQAGWGTGASPLITGRTELHKQLERELAQFEGTEAALLFPTGYVANMGTIAALVGPGDAIFSDSKNHASIIDGCRLSGAAIHVYHHRNIEHLKSLLKEAPATCRRMIVTDTLFSMDGDLAPLPRLVELAAEFGAMLVVDEAHATGVFGRSGRGACEHFSVENSVHVRIGTLSKGLGSLGGFVAGEQRLIDWLSNRARPYFFSTAAPAALVAAGRKALSIVRSEPQRREALLARAKRLREMLREAKLSIGSSESQIIPIILGNPARTMTAAAELRRRGFFVPAIRPPSVPQGESLLRISLTCLHTDQQINDLVAALQDVAR
jgi:8-amino-7-oxononanoate synthase